jgi:hypothetical protein
MSKIEEYSFLIYFNEIKTIIKNIGKNPSINEFSTILLYYDDFLNNIKINSSKTKIKYMIEYIIQPELTPNIFFNKILFILNDIINKYLNLDIEIRTANQEINNYLIHCIYKTIFILYEYYYYIKELTIYYQNNPSGTISNYLNKLNQTINTKIKNIDKRLYYNIIKNFYKDVLKIPEITLLDKIYLPIDLIVNNYKRIKSYFNDETLDNIYLKSILLLIIKINDDIKIKSSNINTFITLPQYYGICWYISILTAMCYSDGSKNLIIKKMKSPKSSTNSKTIFKNFINYIITNITNTNKKYSNPITNDCEYFKMFKTNQYSYLLNRYKEFFLEKVEILKELNYSNIDDIIGCDDDYYYYYIYSKKRSY